MATSEDANLDVASLLHWLVPLVRSFSAPPTLQTHRRSKWDEVSAYHALHLSQQRWQQRQVVPLCVVLNDHPVEHRVNVLPSLLPQTFHQGVASVSMTLPRKDVPARQHPIHHLPERVHVHRV